MEVQAVALGVTVLPAAVGARGEPEQPVVLERTREVAYRQHGREPRHPRPYAGPERRWRSHDGRQCFVMIGHDLQLDDFPLLYEEDGDTPLVLKQRLMWLGRP